MTLGLSGVCYIVAIILFILSAVPLASDYRLERVGLAFFAAGHVL
jgi:hypothetical protein